MRRDPSGLIVGPMLAAGAVLLLPGPGDFLSGALSSLTMEYAANQEWDLEWAGDHHIIPIYMGGARGGATRRLTHSQHVEIHRLIDEAGAQFGIPRRSQGARKVETWLQGNLEVGPTQMRLALIDAYSKFDLRHGTRLTDVILKEITGQQWRR